MTEERTVLEASDRFAIGDLLTEFGRRIDHGRAAGVADLFVEDGLLITPMFTLQGREQIAAHFAKRDAGGNVVSRHQWSSLRLEPIGNGDVRAEMIVHTQLGTRTGNGPVRPDHSMVGDSFDVVRRDAAGAWRFVQRRLEIAFRWAPGPAEVPAAATPAQAPAGQGNRPAHG